MYLWAVCTCIAPVGICTEPQVFCWEWQHGSGDKVRGWCGGGLTEGECRSGGVQSRCVLREKVLV
jgi:hypothetical protein